MSEADKAYIIVRTEAEAEEFRQRIRDGFLFHNEGKEIEVVVKEQLPDGRVHENDRITD